MNRTRNGFMISYFRTRPRESGVETLQLKSFSIPGDNVRPREKFQEDSKCPLRFLESVRDELCYHNERFPRVPRELT